MNSCSPHDTIMTSLLVVFFAIDILSYCQCLLLDLVWILNNRRLLAMLAVWSMVVVLSVVDSLCYYWVSFAWRESAARSPLELPNLTALVDGS